MGRPEAARRRLGGIPRPTIKVSHDQEETQEPTSLEAME